MSGGAHPLKCSACGRHMSPGAALRVMPVDVDGSGFAVHRPTQDARCFPVAGTRAEATIALYDPDAARELDRGAYG